MFLQPQLLNKLLKKQEMKFVNYMEKVSGIDIYGLISLSLFFTIFVVVLIGVAVADKKKMKEMSDIPLDSK